MNPQRPARLNRTVLALLGLLCLAAGAFVLLAGTGVLGTPFGIREDARLLTGSPAATWYLPWAGAVVAVVIAGMTLRWLLAQTVRKPRGGEWQLGGDTRAGGTFIDSDIAAASFADEIADYPGVLSADARLTGSRQEPHLYVWVTTSTRSDITGLRRRIADDAVPHLVLALELATVSTEIVVRLGSASGSRVRTG